MEVKKAKNRNQIRGIITYLVHHMLELLEHLESIHQNGNKLDFLRPIQDVSIALMLRHKIVVRSSKLC